MVKNFEGGSGVPLLNFDREEGGGGPGGPGSTFKLQRGPASRGPGPTFTPCREC